MDSEIEPGSLGSSSLGSLNVCSQMMVRTGRAGRLKGVGTWWSISLFSWSLKTFRVVPFFFFCIHTKKHLLGTNHGPKKRTSLVAQTVKRLPTVQETRFQSLGGEDPLEKEMTEFEFPAANYKITLRNWIYFEIEHCLYFLSWKFTFYFRLPISFNACSSVQYKLK